MQIKKQLEHTYHILDDEGIVMETHAHEDKAKVYRLVQDIQCQTGWSYVYAGVNIMRIIGIKLMMRLVICYLNCAMPSLSTLDTTR